MTDSLTLNLSMIVLSAVLMVVGIGTALWTRDVGVTDFFVLAVYLYLAGSNGVRYGSSGGSQEQ